MHSLRPVIFLVILGLNAALGLRGLWNVDRNFFTMHPFSDPIVHCTIEVINAKGNTIALLRDHYRFLKADEFEGRLYLELLPLQAEGLTEYLQKEHPGSKVSIECRELHGNPPTVFYS